MVIDSPLQDPTGARPTFGSFWHGSALSAYESTCIASFVRRGYDYALYSYDPSLEVPPGVDLLDARTVAPYEEIDQFLYEGRPHLSHFSDYFRYRMFEVSDRIWVDTDVLLLAPFPEPVPSTLLTRETPDSLCNAVLRLDAADMPLGELVDRTKALAGKPLRWGDTGPRLLTSVVDDARLSERAAPPEVYYPVLFDVFWKVFLPEERDECAARCEAAATLHLWNNIVVQLGVWKELAPPRGSYLHEVFEREDALGGFRATYPADVMRRMIDNWRLRFSGADVGGGNLLRQLGPSAVRTARRKGWLRP